MPPTDRADANHPLALRMGVIGFLSQNTTMGCLYGTFGVLLLAVEAKLGVGRQLSSLPMLVVTLAISVSAPVAGILSGRMSLRLLMMVGAVMGAAGYAMLAVSRSIWVDVAAYGLLVGPAACLTGSVLPATLVSRWFATKRGRALGFMHIPIIIGIMPLLSAAVLQRYGLSTVYTMLAVMMALILVPMVFVVDHPPSMDDAVVHATAGAAPPGLTIGQLLSSVRFWVLTIAWGSSTSATIMLTTHIISMAQGWHIDTNRAAGLLTLNSFAAVAGTPLFGWLADKLGGRTAMALICFDSVLFWLALLLHPTLPVVAVVLALNGIHVAASVPVFGLAVSEQFGQANFGRAFGLGSTAALPFTIASVPLAAAIYARTGSYSGAIMFQIGYFLVAGVLVLMFGGGRSAEGRKHFFLKKEPKAYVEPRST